MTAPAQKAIAFDFGFSFRSFAEQIKGEREDRIEHGKHILPFGVDFADRALGGIYRRDLILIGAASGHGKTEFVTAVAKHNARKGKRVHYFALEAEPLEIERRIKFQLVADAVFDDVERGRLDKRAVRGFRYRSWYEGRFDDLCAKYERAAEQIVSDEFRTLFTCYKFRDFTGNDFEKACLAIQDETDLIVLDHLHYLDTNDPNENAGYKAIVKQVRNVQAAAGKPVLLVAHVRKADRFVKRAVPTLDDFHGTSDIPKIATKALMLARGPSDPTNPLLRSTLMAPLKNRFDGSVTFYVGAVSFDVQTNRYQSGFKLGTLKTEKNAETFHPLDDVSSWPAWTIEPDAAPRRCREPGED